MKRVRREVFETNSSSVHTITISKEGLDKPNLEIRRRKREDGTFGKYIIGRFGSFDKNTCDYFTQDEKLSYLLTICFLTDGHSCLEDMLDSWEFSELEDEIKEYMKDYCEVDGIKIDKSSIDEAYIDHQTLTDYFSLSDFKMDYKDFVFNRFIGLHTTCD